VTEKSRKISKVVIGGGKRGNREEGIVWERKKMPKNPAVNKEGKGKKTAIRNLGRGSKKRVS